MKKILLFLSLMLGLVVSGMLFTACGDDDDEVSPGGGNGKAPSSVKAVDLGLPSGTMWANMNVGALSEEGPGNTYAWGETEVKSSYTKENYFVSYSKYIGSGELLPEYDAAYVNWGKDWRMPTYEQIVELRGRCSWNWTTVNDVNGYKVVGPNGNHIFLPKTSGLAGFYWSRTLYSSYPDGARSLGFDSSGYGYRYNGGSVRPVRVSQ